MADGDNLVIGNLNTGDHVTRLKRSSAIFFNEALEVTNDNGHGIRSRATGTAASPSAVVAESSEGTGVIADSYSASPLEAGLDAQHMQGTAIRATSNAGTAVEATSNAGIAVEAQSKQNVGVRGIGRRSGVFGLSTGIDNAAGVTGVAVRGVEGFGTTTGVYGQHDSVGGIVRSGFENVGVGGRSNAHHGVFGFSDAPLVPRMISAGVAGQSASEVGVAGESLSTSFGVFGRANLPGGFGVVGFSRNGVGISAATVNGLAATFSGRVVVSGDLFATGAKAAVVSHPDGSHRALYAVESPESWFEDFGSAQLTRGRAIVRLERAFSALIATKEYHVFLTPEGDSQGLFVADKKRDSFEVREQQDGRNSLRFSYRVVARRSDLRGRRLEKVTIPEAQEGLERRILRPRPIPPPEEVIVPDVKLRRKPRRRPRI